MKVLFRLLQILPIFFCLFVPPISAWQVEDLNINIQINRDSTAMVTERIVAGFPKGPIEAVVREIPLNYKDERGNAIRSTIEINGVFDEEGLPIKYEEANDGQFILLSIEKPEIVINAQKLFIIQYKLKNAILFLSDRDQLLWKISGREFDSTIDKFKVTVRFPDEVVPENVRVSAFSITESPAEEIEVKPVQAEKNLTYEIANNIAKEEDFTLVVTWPKQIVKGEFPAVAPAVKGELPKADNFSAFKKALRLSYERILHKYQEPSAEPQGAAISDGNLERAHSLADHSRLIAEKDFSLQLWPFLLPLGVLGYFLIRHHQQNRYPPGYKAQLVDLQPWDFQPPDNLRPALLGLMIDLKFERRDVTASLLDLAVRGYMKIIKRDAAFFQKEYSFIKLKEFDSAEELLGYEKLLLSVLFGNHPVGTTVSTSQIEYPLCRSIPVIKESALHYLKEKEFLYDHPKTMRETYQTICLSLLSGAGVCFLLSQPWAFVPLPWAFSTGFALGWTTLIIFYFGKSMPLRTLRGVKACKKIQRFEDFLMKSDKANLPQEDRPKIFTENLSYAVSLGLSKPWMNAFRGLFVSAPGWFDGDYRGVFTMDLYFHDLGRVIGEFNYTFSQIPRSATNISRDDQLLNPFSYAAGLEEVRGRSFWERAESKEPRQPASK